MAVIGDILRKAGVLGGGWSGLALGGATAAYVGGEILDPLATGARDAFSSGPFDRSVQREMAAREFGVSERLKQDRLQKLASANAARLAALQPDIYNQVMAGRRLPRGAVVIGGVPRTDLLAEVASRMGTQGPPQSQSPMDQFLSGR